MEESTIDTQKHEMSVEEIRVLHELCKCFDETMKINALMSQKAAEEAFKFMEEHKFDINRINNSCSKLCRDKRIGNCGLICSGNIDFKEKWRITNEQRDFI